MSHTLSSDPLALEAAYGPMLLCPAGGCPEPARRRAGEEATVSSSAPSARMALPVSARPASRAPCSSGRGRGGPRGLRWPWMEADVKKQTELQLLTAIMKQEERVKFPAQGLMGQEAGSHPKLTREMRKRKRGAYGAA